MDATRIPIEAAIFRSVSAMGLLFLPLMNRPSLVRDAPFLAISFTVLVRFLKESAIFPILLKLRTTFRISTKVATPRTVFRTLPQSIAFTFSRIEEASSFLELKKSGIVLVKNVVKKFLILVQTLETVVFTVPNQSEKAEPKADRRAFSRAHKLSSPLTSLLKKLDRASFSRLPKSPRFLMTGSMNRLILSQVLRSVSDVLTYSMMPLTQSLTFAIASGILPTKSLMP